MVVAATADAPSPPTPLLVVETVAPVTVELAAPPKPAVDPVLPAVTLVLSPAPLVVV